MQKTPKITINYKSIRKINPEAARTAVLHYLSSNGGNVSSCARAFNITRVTVMDIIKKEEQGDLKDRSKAPKRVANKTSLAIEKKILEAKNKTGFGVKKLSKFLQDYHGLKISHSTLRGILKRNIKLYKY